MPGRAHLEFFRVGINMWSRAALSKQKVRKENSNNKMMWGGRYLARAGRNLARVEIADHILGHLASKGCENTNENQFPSENAMNENRIPVLLRRR